MVKYKRTHQEIVNFLIDITRQTNITNISLLTVERCWSLKDIYKYSYWDSLILSAAIESNCNIFYSEDMQHGQVIEGTLTIQNPFFRP
jgi:predicted nucleic acid-binding protein